ncbi:MAG: hypothetical protein R6X22_02970 [Gemmatimonadota bacterium]
MTETPPPEGRPDPLAELYASTRAIGLRDRLDELLEEVLDQAQRLIGAEHAALMLYDERQERLNTVSLRGYGDRADYLRARSLTLGEGLSGWVHIINMWRRLVHTLQSSQFRQNVGEHAE